MFEAAEGHRARLQRFDELLHLPEAECFFRGEFVLALTRVDQSLTRKQSMDRIAPLPGLYLFYWTERCGCI